LKAEGVAVQVGFFAASCRTPSRTQLDSCALPSLKQLSAFGDPLPIGNV